MSNQTEALKIDKPLMYSLECEPSDKEIAQAIKALKRIRKTNCTAVVQKGQHGGFWWGFTKDFKEE